MWSAGGLFHRTRIVAVSPRLLLVNAFGRGLEVRQDDGLGSEACTTLLTAQRSPLYWANGAGARYLRVRIREFGWEWSGRFAAHVAGDTTLRLRNTHNEVKCFMQVRTGPPPLSSWLSSNVRPFLPTIFKSDSDGLNSRPWLPFRNADDDLVFPSVVVLAFLCLCRRCA
jgi:hypothetical protein